MSTDFANVGIRIHPEKVFRITPQLRRLVEEVAIYGASKEEFKFHEIIHCYTCYLSENRIRLLEYGENDDILDAILGRDTNFLDPESVYKVLEHLLPHRSESCDREDGELSSSFWDSSSADERSEFADDDDDDDEYIN